MEPTLNLKIKIHISDSFEDDFLIETGNIMKICSISMYSSLIDSSMDIKLNYLSVLCILKIRL